MPARDLAAAGVAHLVAQRVVDVLEAVEVADHDRGAGTVPAADLGQHVGRAAAAVAAVDQPGERVVADGRGSAVDQPAVAQREARVVGDRLDQPHVGGVEGAHLAHAAGHHQAAGDLDAPRSGRRSPSPSSGCAQVGRARSRRPTRSQVRRQSARRDAERAMRMPYHVRSTGVGTGSGLFSQAGPPAAVPAEAVRCSAVASSAGGSPRERGAKTISACSARAISRAGRAAAQHLVRLVGAARSRR